VSTKQEELLLQKANLTPGEFFENSAILELQQIKRPSSKLSNSRLSFKCEFNPF